MEWLTAVIFYAIGSNIFLFWIAVKTQKDLERLRKENIRLKVDILHK